MALAKKPVLKKAPDDFIDQAQADNSSRKTGAAAAKKPEKKTKLTFYMTDEMYMKWEGYKLKQLQGGKKVTFQGVVLEHLNEILGDHPKTGAEPSVKGFPLQAAHQIP